MKHKSNNAYFSINISCTNEIGSRSGARKHNIIEQGCFTRALRRGKVDKRACLRGYNSRKGIRKNRNVNICQCGAA